MNTLRVSAVRQLFCTLCGYHRNLWEDEAPPDKCPACYGGVRSYTYSAPPGRVVVC